MSGIWRNTPIYCPAGHHVQYDSSGNARVVRDKQKKKLSKKERRRLREDWKESQRQDTMDWIVEGYEKTQSAITDGMEEYAAEITDEAKDLHKLQFANRWGGNVNSLKELEATNGSNQE